MNQKDEIDNERSLGCLVDLNWTTLRIVKAERVHSC